MTVFWSAEMGQATMGDQGGGLLEALRWDADVVTRDVLDRLLFHPTVASLDQVTCSPVRCCGAYLCAVTTSVGRSGWASDVVSDHPGGATRYPMRARHVFARHTSRIMATNS